MCQCFQNTFSLESVWLSFIDWPIFTAYTNKMVSLVGNLIFNNHCNVKDEFGPIISVQWFVLFRILLNVVLDHSLLIRFGKSGN